MSVPDYKINYKSDFVLTINGDAGWAVPFCIKFWTGMPSQAYFVGFDGVKYVNCRVGDTPTQLMVMFDDHHLPIGKLMMQIAYHTTIEEFPGSVFDEVTNARDVIVTIDGTDYQVMLDFTGEDAPELEFDLPAYANEAERIQNELQRQQNEADRIAAELQREQATAAAVQGAENVNAQLNGTTLTVTNRQGVSTSVNTKGEQGAQGPVGPEGPQGEQGVSIVSFRQVYASETATYYSITFSDGHEQSVAIPKGAKGDTGATGPTGPQGPQGQTGVSITGFVKTGETETDTLYNITFSNGTTQQVAIPKGEKGDQGNSGYTGAADELEIVNNLTQGGAMAALSAEMGKVLAESCAFKDAEAQMGGYAYGVLYSNSSTWTWYNDGRAKHRVITLQGDEKYIKITANAAHGAGIGFLKTYTAPTQQNQSVDWCSGYSHGQGPVAGETAIYPIPSDCNYIVVDTTINNLDYSPAYIGLGISNQEVYDEASDADLKVLINDGNFTRAIGAVNSVSGLIEEDKTNNFYVDITIPAGSKSVSFQTYPTGNYFGCAFMNGSTYVSGYNSNLSTVGRITLSIPDGATKFRFSYYTDRYANLNNLPIFDGIVFYKYGSEGYILNELENKESALKDNVTITNITRSVGTVYYNTGEVYSNATNNFWTDIEIPQGSKTVNFQVFRTGGDFGCAFMNEDGWVKGFKNKNTQQDVGDRATVLIPDGATIFRYSYLTDSFAQQNDYPVFDNIVFGTEIGIAQLAENVNELNEMAKAKYLERPDTGCHAFSVKVNISIPKLDETDSASIQDSYTEGTDYGFIMLPTNYTADGEPTRLVITCHGAGASLSDYQSSVWKNFSQTYWCSLGYAVMDMYACPPELSGSTSEMHYGNPTVLECYKKGFDYVMEKFNLRRDGIFVLGSSMGGLSSFQIVDSGMFPVLAQIGNCPCIDIFKQAYCNPWTTATYQRQRIATYFGFEGTAPTWTTSKPPSAAETQYFISNFGKTIGYYPILKNVVSGDISSIFDVIPSSVAAVTDAEEAVLYDALTSIHPCPIKIFHCKDDTTMAYRYSKYFIDMVRRSGQLAYFRPFATGGHNAWDAGNTTSVTDIDGNSLTLSASKYEAYLFFKRFDK